MFGVMLPGIVLGLREGLEAFLMIGIILDYLKKQGADSLKRPVQFGLAIGIVASLVLGLALWAVSGVMGSFGSSLGTVWESLASLLALVLLTTFIVWMMKHGKTVYQDVQALVKVNFSRQGLFLISFVMVVREGAEIALFAFAAENQQSYVIGVLLGCLFSAILAWLISKALVRINLKVLFSVTLGYVVLQAAYLLGYGIHELLSVLKDQGVLAADNMLLQKAWNLKDTVLDHKTAWLGISLNIVLGWPSRPEWLQIGAQFVYGSVLFAVWAKISAAYKAAKKTDAP